MTDPTPTSEAVRLEELREKIVHIIFSAQATSRAKDSDLTRIRFSAADEIMNMFIGYTQAKPEVTTMTDDTLDAIFQRGVEAHDNLRGAESAADVRLAQEQLAEAKAALAEEIRKARVDEERHHEHLATVEGMGCRDAKLKRIAELTKGTTHDP